MMSGARLQHALGMPQGAKDLTAFVSALAEDAKAVGRWAETGQCGPGAADYREESRASDAGAACFCLARHLNLVRRSYSAVRDRDETRIVPVTLQRARGELDVSGALDSSPPIPFAEYRTTGEPPSFRVTSRARDRRGTRLLTVVAERPVESPFATRDLYHVAIEESGNAVTAGAIDVSSSPAEIGDSLDSLFPDGLGVCYNAVGGFVAAATISLPRHCGSTTLWNPRST